MMLRSLKQAAIRACGAQVSVHSTDHQWNYFPNMTNEELLLIRTCKLVFYKVVDYLVQYIVGAQRTACLLKCTDLLKSIDKGTCLLPLCDTETDRSFNNFLRASADDSAQEPFLPPMHSSFTADWPEDAGKRQSCEARLLLVMPPDDDAITTAKL